ncbi:MAG: CocE/NonD family hydrolase [Proteobacteria bacterium]|nr:CocE/NonD family hydrolase [Pseudomonadota bacterium]
MPQQSPRRILTRFPRAVREIENVWIPMPDGIRLAARIWLPVDAEENPVPAILEYMPYRKRDLLRLRDQSIHPYFAGHGYAALRVDTRGAGDSDGVLEDMWDGREQADGLAIIEWLRKQPWCTGAVGMFGKSWSGLSGLQAAARAPSGLKAIITVCSSEDRYTTTLHYTGGAVLVDTVWWASSMLVFNSLPPDPETAGADWQKKWQARLAANKPMISDWLDHQRRDAYWLEGSTGGTLDNIEAAVYAVGGWADYLSRAVPRMMEGIKAPRRALIGPWCHNFPHDARPGPEIGFLQDCLRWWDKWLKGVDTGIDREPVFWAWMQDSVRPQADYDHRPGRWVAERSWPSKRIKPVRWYLNAGSLDRRAKAKTKLVHRSPQTVGLCSLEWLGAGVPGELPRDQREDDGRSLAFDSPPLEQRVEILGECVAHLELAVDRPAALVAVRLCDVAPDGASTRVTYQVLNLTHRQSHEEPKPLVPGRRYRVAVRLPSVAYGFPKGHRIRVALSTSYWPVIWPSPEPVTLTLYAGASAIELPVRPADPADKRLPEFGPPEQAPPEPITRLEDAKVTRLIERDPRSGHVRVILNCDGGVLLGPVKRYRIDRIGTEIATTLLKRCDIDDDDPLSAKIELTQTTEIGREGWRVRVDVRVSLASDRDYFHVEATAKASLNGATVSDRAWRTKHRRDLV